MPYASHAKRSNMASRFNTKLYSPYQNGIAITSSADQYSRMFEASSSATSSLFSTVSQGHRANARGCLSLGSLLEMGPEHFAKCVEDPFHFVQSQLCLSSSAIFQVLLEDVKAFMNAFMLFF
jgi:hypothetical protein